MMGKTELAKVIAEKENMNKAQSQRIVNEILAAIENEVSLGEKVTLMGFGSFERRERPARTGRNPQTGEVITIPAQAAVHFKPGKEFKDKVNCKDMEV